jgi:hypothetical protein
MELEPISPVYKSLGLLGLNYDFCNVVFWGPNQVPACKLSMILYYKAREPCMARVLSSTVQYVIACFTASYRIFSSWVHNTQRLQLKIKCKTKFFPLHCRSWGMKTQIFFSSFYDFISIFRLFYMCKLVFTAFGAILDCQKMISKFFFLPHFVQNTNILLHKVEVFLVSSFFLTFPQNENSFP